MIKMRCQCKPPLSCIYKTEPQIKLGAFDSAGIVSGLGITERTDQIIKFASILLLGTLGYQAPDVLLNVLLYIIYNIIYILLNIFLCLRFHAYHSASSIQNIYTTAIDIRSFGYLCLNI